MNAVDKDVFASHAEAVQSRAQSAISWGAILGGGLAAAAISLILLMLGVGLGLSAVSPWSYRGASTSTLAFGAIAWLLVTSLCASGLGGYIAGRLRTQWSDADSHETHFRDTAHGFLAWSVATIIGAGLLATVTSSIVGIEMKGGAAIATAAAVGVPSSQSIASPEASNRYFVDMMFRGARSGTADAEMNGTLREATSILAAAPMGVLSPGDQAYLAELVVNRTGLARADAEQRVAQTTAAAKLATEAAAAKGKALAEDSRRVSARTALWVFISLLVGAFYASLAATWGGRQRDPAGYVRSAI